MTDRELRRRAESLLHTQKDALSDDDFLSMAEVLEELQIHQAELTIQNEELRQSQNRLMHLSRRYKDLFDRVPAPCLVLDSEGVIKEANWAAEALFDRSRKTLAGLPFMALVLSPFQTTVTENRTQTFLKKGIHKADAQVEGPGGKTLQVRIESTSFEEEGESLCLTTLIDLTQLRELEAEQKKNQKETLNLLKRQKNFLANVNHELRTPLTAILAAYELLTTTELTAEQQDFSETIYRSSHHLLTLIEDLLKFHRQQNKGTSGDREVPFVFSEMTNDLYRTFKPQAEYKSLEFEVNVPATVPRVLIGCESVLRQVLSNLVGNALKFTEKGSIVLQANWNRDKAGQSWLIVDVVDTGIGMNPAYVKEAFDRFSQEKSDEDRPFGGLGLGLAICKELLFQVGGTIDVTSRIDQGSAFHVTFPVRTKPAATAPETTGLDVLLVEDNIETGRLIELALRKQGLKVQWVKDGSEALKAFSAQQPGLVLLDLQLPQMDGYEVLRRMKDQLTHENGPCFWAVSGHLMVEMLPQVKAAGFDDYVEKPFNVNDFSRKVMECLHG